MQVVRVTTRDSENAKLLVAQLAGLFGGKQISLQADGEVQVQLPELDGELVKTLKAVERWLEQSGISSAEVSVNEHSYTVEHPERVKASTVFSGSNGPRSVAAGDRDGSREAVGLA
jgi:preprotein translocase subunit SecD